MAYTIERSHYFDDDYDDILSYLVNELKSPHAALDLINEAERVASLLSDNPFINAVSDKPLLSVREYREQLVKRYVIVYRIEHDVVYFLGMFHQTQLYDYRLLNRRMHDAGGNS